MAATPQPQWVHSAGGESYDYTIALAVDAAGNSHMAGEFRETASFGSLSLTSVSPLTADVCIVKYDSAGNPLWARSAGGTLTDSAKAIALDPAGNVYVTGDFRGAANFSASVINSSGAEDMFVAKYDPSGNLLWVRKGGGTGQDNGFGIAATTNAVFVVGSYLNIANFSGTNLNSSGGYDIFVAKYDGAGNLLWIRSAGGTANDRALAVAVDSSGGCRVTGFITSTTATFSGVNITNASTFYTDAFVARYDSIGNLLWATRAGGTENERSLAVACDPVGNSFITGTFASTNMPGGSGSLPRQGGSDVFIAKFSATGAFQWAVAGGSVDEDVSAGIALDAAGNCHITGHHSDDITFGAITLTNTGFAGSLDGFIAKCDATGNFIWATKVGGVDDESPVAIGLDAAEDIFVTGSFTTPSATVANLTLTNAGFSDQFLVKLGAEQPVLNAERTAGAFVISWPDYLQGYTLESISDPAATNSWSPVTNASVLIGNHRFVTNPISTTGSRFFRMRKN